MPKELLRQEVTDDDLPVKEKCHRCGSNITLWFNSGELDFAKCCGLTYELQHVRIDFVVSENKEVVE